MGYWWALNFDACPYAGRGIGHQVPVRTKLRALIHQSPELKHIRATCTVTSVTVVLSSKNLQEKSFWNGHNYLDRVRADFVFLCTVRYCSCLRSCTRNSMQSWTRTLRAVLAAGQCSDPAPSCCTILLHHPVAPSCCTILHHAPWSGSSDHGGRIYTTLFPCNECAKVIIQAELLPACHGAWCVRVCRSVHLGTRSCGVLRSCAGWNPGGDLRICLGLRFSEIFQCGCVWK